MPRFIIKCAVFVVLQALLFAAVLMRYDTSTETNYLAATSDKHRKLESEQSPRVILVGGSNVAFGFNTERIEQTLGRPAVNMGLAAGLGIEFMLSEIQPALRQGDVVVLSLEYEHFARGPNPSQHSTLGFDPELLRQVLVFRPRGILSLGRAHFRRILLNRGLATVGEILRRALLTNIKAKALEGVEVRASRRAFNSWGDVVAHRSEPPRAKPVEIDALPLVADVRGFPSRVALDNIRRFVEWSSGKGIRVAFTFPPKPNGAMRRQGGVADQLARELNGIPGLAVLDRPQDESYPPEQFFDTANHLTADAAEARTSKVIQSLSRLMTVSR